MGHSPGSEPQAAGTQGRANRRRAARGAQRQIERAITRETRAFFIAVRSSRSGATRRLAAALDHVHWLRRSCAQAWGGLGHGRSIGSEATVYNLDECRGGTSSQENYTT